MSLTLPLPAWAPAPLSLPCCCVVLMINWNSKAFSLYYHSILNERLHMVKRNDSIFFDKGRTLYGEKEPRHLPAITCINTPPPPPLSHNTQYTHTHLHTHTQTHTHTVTFPFFCSSALPPCPEPPLVRQHQPRHGSCTETLSPKGTRQRYHEGNLTAILSSFVQPQRNPRWCSLWSGLGATRDGCLHQFRTNATLGICISFYASQAKSRNLDRPILQSIRNTNDTQASGRRYTVLPERLVDCRVSCTQHPSKY